MNINGIGSYSQSTSQIKERMQEFKKGKANLSKDDLTEMQADLASNGASSKRLDNMISNYDKIDLNGDGLNISELKTYKRTTFSSKSESDGEKEPGQDGDITKEQMQKRLDKLLATNDGTTAGPTENPNILDLLFDNQSSASSSLSFNSLIESSGLFKNLKA